MKHLILFCLVLLTAGMARAESSLEISSPYAFATAESAKNGAAFMTMMAEEDTLLSVSGDVAETIEIHTMTMEGGIMQMRKLENLPVKGETVLEPKANHIMLIGLKEPLKQGATFPLTLHFEKAGDQTVEVSVMAPGKKPGMSH